MIDWERVRVVRLWAVFGLIFCVGDVMTVGLRPEFLIFVKTDYAWT